MNSLMFVKVRRRVRLDWNNTRPTLNWGQTWSQKELSLCLLFSCFNHVCLFHNSETISLCLSKTTFSCLPRRENKFPLCNKGSTGLSSQKVISTSLTRAHFAWSLAHFIRLPSFLRRSFPAKRYSGGLVLPSKVLSSPQHAIIVINCHFLWILGQNNRNIRWWWCFPLLLWRVTAWSLWGFIGLWEQNSKEERTERSQNQRKRGWWPKREEV